jgi:hypothetical protein
MFETPLFSNRCPTGLAWWSEDMNIGRSQTDKSQDDMFNPGVSVKDRCHSARHL